MVIFPLNMMIFHGFLYVNPLKVILSMGLLEHPVDPVLVPDMFVVISIKIIYIYIYILIVSIYMYIYGCVFFSGVQILVRVGSSSSANHTHESYPEPYPESYLRIIPPKITIMNVSFGIVWDCMASLVLMDVTSQLTSVGQIR